MDDWFLVSILFRDGAERRYQMNTKAKEALCEDYPRYQGKHEGTMVYGVNGELVECLINDKWERGICYINVARAEAIDIHPMI